MILTFFEHLINRIEQMFKVVIHAVLHLLSFPPRALNGEPVEKATE